MPFGALWLPVVLSSVAMFLLGGVAWMVLPHHKKQWKRFPDESAARLLLKALPPGQYRIPYTTGPNPMKDPAFLARHGEGPVGTLALEKPGPMGMGRRLGLTFAVNFAIAFTTAYVLWLSLGWVHVGGLVASPRDIFQIAAAVTFGFHVFALFPEAIWFSKSWRRIGWEIVDAIVYAVVTGAIFTHCWPGTNHMS